MRPARALVKSLGSREPGSVIILLVSICIAHTGVCLAEGPNYWGGTSHVGILCGGNSVFGVLTRSTWKSKARQAPLQGPSLT
jgi:hypothetical protein